jgi:Tautomerase enzyme
MPLVDIHLIKGFFDYEQKATMIRKVTDTMVGARTGDAPRDLGPGDRDRLGRVGHRGQPAASRRHQGNVGGSTGSRMVAGPVGLVERDA